jgi:DNA polymerase-3 subunit epsilon
VFFPGMTGPLDEAAVSSFADEAVIVVAHNSGFDRKFAERYWPIFNERLGAVQRLRSNGAGLFHQAHRAVDNCHALLEILSFELPTTGTSALAVLLARACKRTMRLWAEQSPFDLKDALKRRGYRWSDGSDRRPRSWYVDIDEDKLDGEIAFLKGEVYFRDVEPRLQTLTAFDRFSIRA